MRYLLVVLLAAAMLWPMTSGAASSNVKAGKQWAGLFGGKKGAKKADKQHKAKGASKKSKRQHHSKSSR